MIQRSETAVASQLRVVEGVAQMLKAGFKGIYALVVAREHSGTD
jgi:hypothetical protein